MSLPVRRPISRAEVIFILAAALIAGILLWFSMNRYGIGIGADGTNYLSTANNLAAGIGFVNYDTSPYVHWTPLYPMTLALFKLVGFDPLVTARVLSVLAWMAIIVMGGLWITSRIQHPGVRLIAVLLTLASAPLYRIAHSLLTDLPLALFVLATLIALDSYTQERRPRDLWIAAVLALLACQTRYAGAVVVFAGLVVIYLDRGRWTRKVRDGVLFAAISLLPLILWMLNNYRVSGTFVGPRVSASRGAADNLALAFDVVWSWLLPIPFPSAELKIIIVGLIVLAAPILIISLIFARYRRAFRPEWYRAALLASFLYAYLVFMILSSSVTRLDPLNDRFFAPIFVPLIFSVAFIVDNALRDQPHRRWIPAVGIILALMTGVTSILGIVETTRNSRENGAGGFTQTSWVESPLMQHVRSLPEGILFSNAPDAIYVYTGRTALPAPTAEQSMRSVLHPILESDSDIPVYWIRFDEQLGSTYAAYSPEQMQLEYVLEHEFEALDGVVYRIVGTV